MLSTVLFMLFKQVNDSFSYPGPLDIPELSARYITAWVSGAKQAHNLTIDLVGLWNEHWEASATMFTYIKELRKQLDAAGLQSTKIIGA